MQQQQTVTCLPPDFAAIESAFFSKMTDLGDRVQELSCAPIEHEADILDAKKRMDHLISDMQALSNSLMEGTRSGFNLGHLRSAIGIPEGAGSAAA